MVVERGARDQEQTFEMRRVVEETPEERAFRWAMDEAWEQGCAEAAVEEEAPMAAAKPKPIPQPKQRPRDLREDSEEREDPEAAPSTGRDDERPDLHEDGPKRVRRRVRVRPAGSREDPEKRVVGKEEYAEAIQSVLTYMPRPFRFYVPSFEEKKVYTSLPDEPAQTFIHRVSANWDGWMGFILTEQLILRIQVCPGPGTVPSFEFHTKEGLKITANIHREFRKKFYDVATVHQDKDPWRKGSLTIMFFQDGLKMMVLQARRGPRMPYATDQWQGYTLFFENENVQGLS